MPTDRIQKKINALLDEAEAAVTVRDWATVRARAESVLAYDRENEDALQHLAAAKWASTSTADAPVGSTGSTREPLGRPESPAGNKRQTLPTSFASGRYTVKKFLGEGGKKRVYLAHDKVLDRDVAFALIKTEGLDDASRTRITREAQAMGRLGDHPNIMPIFDLGQETDPVTGASQPYMVLPLMPSGDVGDVIQKAPDHRMPLERALKITRETVNGLVFAHSKGIVHRDLKPGNVWLTADGTARIGDFGLAVATDRSRLTREGMMVGTAAYMPPEQAMGGEITPRADLYSLGAMLYEMVTGRPPFLGDDDIAIIGQHINTPPVAPTWHRPDCPKPLDALIMRLLAKDPKQRPESANDVLSALEAVSVTGTATAPTPASADGKADPGRSLDSMSSGVFVGRQKEMDQLRAALEETLSGHGRMLTLVGEPGIGKTRTAQELATYSGLRRCQVLWGRCYEGGGAPPYWPWVQAIRSYVRERNPEELRREMGSTASVIAEVVADVKERIPNLQPPPALESPESSRFRLFDSITAFLKTAARTQPIVLVLDDLHWSDKPSLLLLEFVARELANSRLLVIGTYRDMELNRKHPLSVTLGDLIRERLFERVLLRGLQKDDVDRFIEMAAGIKPPPGLVDAVYTQTEGNPLFVTEVVRLLVQEGNLKAGTSPQGRGTTSTWTVRIPEGVREVIGRRLDRLSDRCNDVLTTGAVIGRRFALAALAKLYSDPKLSADERLSEDRLLELMEEALAARIIEELPSGPGRYQFTHALMQETLTSELSTTRKVRLHARIALALEEMYGTEAEQRATELAQHFAEAESLLGPEKLVKYCVLAGEQALAGYAYEDALQQFQRGLAAKGNAKDTQVADLLFGLGRAEAALADRGTIQGPVDTLIKSFDMALSLDDRSRALRVASYNFPNYHGTKGLTELMERALPLAVPGSVQAARISLQLGMFASFEHGELRGQALEDAVKWARHSGDRTTELHALTVSMTVNFFHLRHAETESRMSEARSLIPNVPDMTVQWQAHEFLSTYLGFSGRPDEQLVHAQAALDLALKLRSRFQLLFAYGNMAVAHCLLGNWKDAKENIDAGLAIDPREGRLLGPRWNYELSLGLMKRLAIPSGYFFPAANFADEIVALDGGREYLRESIVNGSVHSFMKEPMPLEYVIPLARAFAAAVTGDSEAVGRHYQHLKQKTFADNDSPLWAFRAVGCVALATGDAVRAEEAFKRTIDRCRKHGARPELARSLNDYAGLLEQRDRPGDKEQAAKFRDEALQLARDLGMKPLIERILKRRQFLKA